MDVHGHGDTPRLPRDSSQRLAAASDEGSPGELPAYGFIENWRKLCAEGRLRVE